MFSVTPGSSGKTRQAIKLAIATISRSRCRVRPLHLPDLAWITAITALSNTMQI